MNTIRNLPFPLKLGAITLVMLLPVLLLGVFFVRTQMEIISFAQNENAGAEYYHELEESLIPLGEREAYLVAAALGDSRAATDAQAATAAVDEVMTAMDAMQPGFDGAEGEAARQWGQIRSSWQALKAERSGLPSEITASHTALRNQIIDFISWIAGTSGITLDPDPVAYFVLDTAVSRVPALEASFADVRALAARVAAQGSAAEAERLEIVRALERIEVTLKGIEGNIAAQKRGGPAGVAIEAEARSAFGALHDALGKYSAYVTDRVVSKPDGNSVEQVMAAGAAIPGLIDTMHDLHQGKSVQLLEERVAAERAAMFEILGLVAAVAAGGAGLHLAGGADDAGASSPGRGRGEPDGRGRLHERDRREPGS